MTGFPDLTPGETVLWEGAPDTKLRFGMETMGTGIFAGALVLACLGLATVINRSDPGTFWVIFAPGVLIAAVVVLAYPVYEAWQRSHTAYRLTNLSAFIATRRDVARFAIPPADHITQTQTAVHFASRMNRNRTRQSIGFERIADAPAVHAIMVSLSQADV